MLVNGPAGIERVQDVNCRPDGSACSATFRGQIFTWYPDPDDLAAGDVTAYTTLGSWEHMRPGAAYADVEGLSGIYAAVDGRRYPDSLPLTGSATWTGEMVALDYNNRLMRGSASLTLEDFSNPMVDVRLEPEASTPMVWNDIPVLAGRFQHSRSSSDYIKGEFYGPNAKEAGGVFERDRMIGAFGAKRQ